MLARRQLAAEQRHRLLAVVRDRLLNRPRGAVGIKVSQRFLPGTIVVEELLPELPARKVLEVGDRITHLEGRPLQNWQEFVYAVQSKLPGSRIIVTVDRLVTNGERADRLHDEAKEPEFESLDVVLELGSANLLRDPNTGLPQSGGPVMIQRRKEAETVLQQFGPPAKRVTIE